MKGGAAHPAHSGGHARHNRGEAPGCIGPTRWTDIYKPVYCRRQWGGLRWRVGVGLFGGYAYCGGHASFGVTCRRWNIGLADGGTQRLPRIVGMGRALELILTGKVIDANEAYRIGLANEVVPKGQGMKRALELAELRRASPGCPPANDKGGGYSGLW